ncbi:MAG: hypothetical protein J1F22_01345 [Lachnospiraceae bacterium]|nr:hypothetical protein [Lachnospiraceae bacterium]
MMSAKKWTISFLALILICLIVIMSLNYFVDPYGYFRSQPGDYYNLGTSEYMREQKAQHIKYFSDRYDAYLIGGSKAGVMQPSKLTELDGYKYYNCWVLSGNFNDYAAYAKYICENTNAKKILLQISTSELYDVDRSDKGPIYKIPAQVTGESKLVEAVTFLMKNPKTSVERLLDPPVIRPNKETGERDISHYYANLKSKLKNDEYYKYIFRGSYVYYKFFYKQLRDIEENKEASLEKLKEIKEVCDKHGVELQVYFAPLFAAQMIQYETDVFYEFMEETVMLCGDVWCFNNYSDIALCPYNFYNPAHFFAEVGNLMVDVMTGKECPFEGFGRLLTRENIGTVIQERKESYQKWKKYYEEHYYPAYDYNGKHYKEHHTLPLLGYDSEANLTKNH